MAGLLQVILTVRDEEKWYRSVRDVIVRLYERLLKPFFWHTRLGRQYTAIIGWGLHYMFHGDPSGNSRVRRKGSTLQFCHFYGWVPEPCFVCVNVLHPAA